MIGAGGGECQTDAARRVPVRFRTSAAEPEGVRLAGIVVAGPGGAGAVILMAGLAEASHRKSESVFTADGHGWGGGGTAGSRGDAEARRGRRGDKPRGSDPEEAYRGLKRSNYESDPSTKRRIRTLFLNISSSSFQNALWLERTLSAGPFTSQKNQSERSGLYTKRSGGPL